jgi:hypothetical protein
MNINQARDYYSIGVITRIIIIPAVMENGFHLSIYMNKSLDSVLLQTAIGHDKLYKSLDSAASDIWRIVGYPANMISYNVYISPFDYSDAAF